MAKTNYVVVQEFTVNNGSRTITVGSVLSLSSEKALPLLERKLIKPQDDESLDFNTGFLSGSYIVTIKTASGRLVELAAHFSALNNVTPGRAMFLADEIEELRNKPSEILERVIDAKELFPGCRIESEGTFSP